MEYWWQQLVVVPVKQVLVAVAARVRARKDEGGVLIKLHNEVKTCGYEDVQVMWEMLQGSAAELRYGQEKSVVARFEGRRCRRGCVGLRRRRPM